jgi:clan AA aspartic protease
MITGVVNARLEATIRLPIRAADGTEREVEGVIDTGFNGSLTLPPTIIASLGLAWRSRGSAILANGRIEQFDVYAATVVWDGVPRGVLVEEADTEPLVGMGLLHRHALRIEAIDGGTVMVEALP